MNGIQIIYYTPTYQADFKRINLEWISDSFSVEPHDLEQLDYPEDHILPRGGTILLALRDTEILGTVAMINTAKPDAPEPDFELAKMAVAKEARGLGIGRLLCEAAIDFARHTGTRRVWLESNRKAVAAIQLYLSVGFVEVPLTPSPYARADIRMELHI
ncbi:GNAT family N-acetyltransferase [Fibrella sp. HMF5335]|uniref:GNAT family N-acetyltransferase n=1 Tax=Fibrella rubiginis TaxID=2817060 RepID=A0A939K6W8_9BACT|nr:GNAT family N-acetyltransferase [Fibrella rubiginis]MBO0938005.1 GNAT family N-acetyltransferase [Fibrella rubiginis]